MILRSCVSVSNVTLRIISSNYSLPDVLNI